ncbi:hypothetical protein [Salmonella enterica]
MKYSKGYVFEAKDD